VLGYHHVLDEVPNSLVSTAALGAAVGVDTPMTKSITDMACAALHFDFWAEGRSLDKLGLAGKTPSEMLSFVNDGPRFWEVP
jgi:opine dehydrogenase